MGEEDLEVLITLDDPGEDELGEDTFHDKGKAETANQQVIPKSRDEN